MRSLIQHLFSGEGRTASRFFILLSGIVVVWASANQNWNAKNWNQILEADARGYYAYLPAVFIYQDLNFGFFETIERDKYKDPHHLYDYRIGANGKIIDKYYAGTALACAPFFLVVHGLSLLYGADADGYAWQYGFSIHIAAICYFLLGCFFLDRMLIALGLGWRTRIPAMLATLFGTNLFYYVSSEPGMSHVFSFAFMALFLFHSLQAFRGNAASSFVWMAFSLGMIILIRPVNGIILLVLPVIAGSIGNFLSGIRSLFSHRSILAWSSALFILLLFLQPLLYKISCGSFFVYAYGEEKFDFLHPHSIDFLFSYRKGLFVYTPLMFLSVMGLFSLSKRNLFQGLYLASFLLLLVYVLSSWWNWWYGGSFSSRVWVEYLPLSCLLLAYFLEDALRFLKGVPIMLLLLLLIAFCQLQTYQYRHYFIHWENMTKEQYWQNFRKLH